MLKFVGVQCFCVVAMAGHFFLMSTIYDRLGTSAGDTLAIVLSIFGLCFLGGLLFGSSQLLISHFPRAEPQEEEEADRGLCAAMPLLLFLTAMVIMSPIHARAATNLHLIEAVGAQVRYPITPQEMSTELEKGFNKFALPPDWIQRETYGFSPSHILLGVRDTSTVLYGQTGPTLINPYLRLPIQDDGRLWVSQIDDMSEYFYTLEDFRRRNPTANVSWSVQILSPNLIRVDWQAAATYHAGVLTAIYVLLGFSLSIAVILDCYLYFQMR